MKRKLWLIYWSVVLPFGLLGVVLLAPSKGLEAVTKLLGSLSPIIAVALSNLRHLRMEVS